MHFENAGSAFRMLDVFPKRCVTFTLLELEMKHCTSNCLLVSRMEQRKVYAHYSSLRHTICEMVVVYVTDDAEEADLSLSYLMRAVIVSLACKTKRNIPAKFPKQ